MQLATTGEACQIEIDRLKKPIGKQDQYAASYGGLSYFQFNSADGTVFVEPILCTPQTKTTLQKEGLLLMYTGMVRSADGILSEQSEKSAKDSSTQLMLRKMKQQAVDLRDALNEDKLDAFGELLHDGWQLKRQIASGVTNPKIDEWYERARNQGAIGGKLLGAGGGGFLLFYAYPEHHEQIKAALPGIGASIVPIRSSGHTNRLC